MGDIAIRGDVNWIHEYELALENYFHRTVSAPCLLLMSRQSLR